MNSPPMKQRAAERLLRLALDASLQLPSRSRRSEAFFERVRDVLQQPRDGSLCRWKERAEEREEREGRKRAAEREEIFFERFGVLPRDDWLSRWWKERAEREGTERAAERKASHAVGGRRVWFDPWAELFGFRRVVSPPWDRVWRDSPLVLHDGGLIYALDFPPYQEAHPHDVTDSIGKILTRHPGPIDSLRMDCSQLPPPEELSRWLDLATERGGITEELVLLDVLQPHSNYPFPYHSLCSPDLKMLALGFFTLSIGLCARFSRLEKLFLICCRVKASEVSMAVKNLHRLKTLGVFGVDLAVEGAGAGYVISGSLDIESSSLSSLEMRESKVCSVILRYVPCLEDLTTGVMSPGVKNPRILSRTMDMDSTPLVRIKLKNGESLNSICNLVLWRHKFILEATQCAVSSLEITLHMTVLEEWRQFLHLTAQLPRLRWLSLTRADDLYAVEELPKESSSCSWDFLQELHLRGYRAGGTEMSLVSQVLATAPHLVGITLYPHYSLVDAAFCHYSFLRCPRLSSAVRICSLTGSY